METTRRAIPTSLKWVAYLFVLEGVCVAIEMIVSLIHGGLNLNFGVLAIWVGFGLLRLSRGWRICALIFTWFGLIMAPIAAGLVMSAVGPLKFKVFGQEVGSAPEGVVLGVSAVVFVLTFWQYSILTRPDIRALFGIESIKPP